MADNKSARVDVSIFDSPAIISLLEQEDGDSIFLIWTKMFLEAKRKRSDFYPLIPDVGKSVSELLAILFQRSEADINKILDLLTELGLIEINDYSVQMIAPWFTNQHYRTTPEYLDWRKCVYERDKYTCRHCNQVGGYLNAHHIKEFSKFKELRYVVENGITLCESCHKAEHERMRQGDRDGS